MDIRYSKQAVEFIKKLSKKQQVKITAAVDLLPLGDVKKFYGEDKYCLYLGDFRIILNKDGDVLIIKKSAKSLKSK